MNKALFNLPVLTTAAFSLAATIVIVALIFADKPTLLLDEPMDVPAFEVTTHDGQVITKDSMLGKVWVCDFFLTRCGLVCPTLAMTMAGVLTETTHDDALAEVQFVSFSVDPEHDTLEVLKTYRDMNRGIWDKGSDSLSEQIEQRWKHARAENQNTFWSLVREGFKLGVGPSNGDPSTPVAHSSQLVLIDRKGRIRGYYEGMNDTEIPALLADIRRLVKEKD